MFNLLSLHRFLQLKNGVMVCNDIIPARLHVHAQFVDFALDALHLVRLLLDLLPLVPLFLAENKITVVHFDCVPLHRVKLTRQAWRKS